MVARVRLRDEELVFMWSFFLFVCTAKPRHDKKHAAPEWGGVNDERGLGELARPECRPALGEAGR